MWRWQEEEAARRWEEEEYVRRMEEERFWEEEHRRRHEGEFHDWSDRSHPPGVPPRLMDAPPAMVRANND